MDLDLGRRSIVEWAEEAPEQGGADFEPAKEKFVVEMPIGRGGMGEVFLVTDQDLKRQVAMKVLRPDLGGGREQRLHFIAEAQATSQLEHPGIPPVHDIGLTPEGRLYFTMKLVSGRTLREVLHDLALKRVEVGREYTLHKLVSILERICEPMHFSHQKGVIHRDIKPENVMLGDFGEVHVMDWGLARVEGSTDEHAFRESVATARTEAGMETQHGALKGTPAYMSPEQARGETLDRKSDIYALGCLLYEMLTLHAAFDPRDPELMSKKQTGEVPDLMTRNPRRPVPEALVEICRKAMATDKAARYETAGAMAGDLRRWLDGRSEKARRHAEAERLAAQGKEAAAAYERLQTEAGEAERAAEIEAAKYKGFQPVSEKRSALDARKRAEELRKQTALAFAGTTQLLGAALVQEEDNATARGVLAHLWKGRLEIAERHAEKVDAAYALTMVERYDDGALAAFVKGDGTVQLASEPAGAEVFLYRYVERDGVLTAEEEKRLGTTPLRPLALPMGSYLCVLRKAGFRDVRYPVHITRNREWKGTVRLRTDEEIREGFVYVPRGPFVYGEGKDTKTLDLPDFAIATYPVTFREYGEFLADLPQEEAEARKPQVSGDGPYMERTKDGTYRILPNNIEGQARERCLREYGPDCEWDLPVAGVNCDDARSYCEWKTRTTGREWRLPTEEEREKAARGVDGRRFPWGDIEDASLGKCRESRDEQPPQPEPVGTFPTAASVSGVGDAAGNRWDWTSSWLDDRHSLRVARGGAWGDPPAALRAAARGALQPSIRSAFFGFRCARGL
jgi:serine/threonine-protein kinase